MLLSAILVYASIIPIISIIVNTTILLFIFSICIFPFHYISKKRIFKYKSNTELLLIAENSVLEQCVKRSEYRHTNTEFKYNNRTVNIHSIICNNLHNNSHHNLHNNLQCKKPDLLIVHGTMGSSISAIKMMDYLSHKFTIHSIDLPGFGRSYACKKLLNMTNSEIIDFYSEILYKYISTHCSNSVCIVAHSFGAFISINFASKHPDIVNKLILIDPAGIFPLLGTYGAYWAIFFKFAIPQVTCKVLGFLAPFIIHTIFNCLQKPLSYDYFFQLIASRLAFAHFFVGRFIKITFLRSSWIHPALHTLTHLPMPIGFIYGEHDNIMPYNQGVVFSKITNNNIPVNIIPGAWHSPQFSHPIECASSIIDIYDNSAKCVPLFHAENIKRMVPDVELKKYHGYYSTCDMDKSIDCLYSKLLNIDITRGNF